MKLFIWKYVNNLTDRYHSDGGAVAIAPNLEEARKLLIEDGAIASGDIATQEPDITCDVEHEAFARVFPDAGCC